MYTIPGHGKDKINAAFAMGGAPLLAQTVEQATGLRLDHYAEIGFGGFAALVDALGGVTVCPTTPLNDPLAGIDLPAGCQRLNGRNALGYVRTRDTPRADLDRMANQRQFVSALLHDAARPAVWLNPWRWYSVPRAAADALTVDRDDHVWDLARLGWALHGSTTTMTVPIGEFTSGDAGSVVVWNHDEASRLFEALAADAPVPADRPMDSNSAVPGPGTPPGTNTFNRGFLYLGKAVLRYFMAARRHLGKPFLTKCSLRCTTIQLA